MITKEKNVNKTRVLVVGDVLMDQWVYGESERLSPEAPIPVVDVTDKKTTLGGAGNVLANLKALNISPVIISGVSEDDVGFEIKKMVKDICGEDGLYFSIPKSFKKQRICSGQQQIVRIDTGEGKDIENVEIDEYLERLEGKIDAVLIADYGKGSVNSYVLGKVSDFCYKEDIDLLIDPYIKNYYKEGFFYCTMVKLNRHEAESFTGIKIRDEQSIIEASSRIFDIFDTKSILLTLGPDGMAYFDKFKYRDKPYRVIDNPLKIYDVCGAGDTVFSALGYFVANKPYNAEYMIDHAAKAGKIAVSKKGTSVVEYKELFSLE